MMGKDLDSCETHKSVQRLAVERHLADLEHLRALERVRAQAVLELELVRSELLEAVLDFRRSQFARQMRHMAQRSALVDACRIRLRRIIRDVVEPQQIVERIGEALSGSPCEAIDWREFDVAFRSIHPTFHSRLDARFPDLTDVEIRVCQLVMLKLTSADIGPLLCVGDRAVARYRHRIRGKLGLSHTDDLHEVLAAI